MDYISYKSIEELLIMKESVEKYLLINDYKNAFTLFLIYTARLNAADREQLITYFYKYFNNKYTEPQ